jgi:hypothetical protein
MFYALKKNEECDYQKMKQTKIIHYCTTLC